VAAVISQPCYWGPVFTGWLGFSGRLASAPPRPPGRRAVGGKLVLGAMARERQENVVEGRPAHSEPCCSYAGGVEAAHRVYQNLRPPIAGMYLHPSRLGISRRLGLAERPDGLHGCAQLPFVSDREFDHVTTDPVLQLLGRSLGDDLTMVDNDYVVRQLVGLFQVLGGEQEGRSLRDQLANNRPHAQTANWIKARGGFVEEQDLRPADQARRQVEPAQHPAGIRLGGPIGCVREVKPLQQFCGPLSRGRLAQMVKPARHLQVFSTREIGSNGRGLSGEANYPPDRGCLAQDVEPAHRRFAIARYQQSGQDPDGGGLTGAVGAEQAEDLAFRNREIYASQRLDVAEGFAQALHIDNRCRRHPSSPAVSYPISATRSAPFSSHRVSSPRTPSPRTPSPRTPSPRASSQSGPSHSASSTA